MQKTEDAEDRRCRGQKMLKIRRIFFPTSEMSEEEPILQSRRREAGQWLLFKYQRFKRECPFYRASDETGCWLLFNIGNGRGGMFVQYDSDENLIWLLFK